LCSLNSPVETGNATEAVNILVQPVDNLSLGRSVKAALFTVALRVLSKELTAHRLCRHHVVIAVVATPLSKVIGDIEGRRRRNRIFIIDEVDRRDAVFGGGETVLARKDNDIGTEEIAVREDELQHQRLVLYSSNPLFQWIKAGSHIPRLHQSPSHHPGYPKPTAALLADSTGEHAALVW
jgi:hypothetical protein